MMMERSSSRRAGMAVAAALLLLVALSCHCGVASAAGRGGTKKKPTLKPGQKPPPNSRFQHISPTKYGKKRNLVASCGDDHNDPNSYSCFVGCPDECPNSCIVFCDYCLAFCECDIFPGTSCGDPRFTGGDGNTFYFHGKKDQDFCVVSDADLHINAHFIGNHNPALNRDFTWVQALGVTFNSQQQPHRLYVGARRAAEWDEDEDHIQVTFDGEPVDVDAGQNARWASRAVPGLSVTRTKDVNAVAVELDGVFAISAGAVPITDRDDRIHKYGKPGHDSLVHLDLGFRFHNLTDNVDGVLGQTYRRGYESKLNISAKMPIMGGAPKYLSAGGLFSTDCAVSRFQHSSNAVAIAAAANANAGVVTTFAS